MRRIPAVLAIVVGLAGCGEGARGPRGGGGGEALEGADDGGSDPDGPDGATNAGPQATGEGEGERAEAPNLGEGDDGVDEGGDAGAGDAGQGEGEGEGPAGQGGGQGEGEGEADGEAEGEVAPGPLPTAPPLLSSSVVQEDDEGGRLIVWCPAGGAVGVSADDAVDHGEQGWGFPTAGAYRAWCALPDGTRLEEGFVVVHEALDDNLAAIGGAITELRGGVADALVADGGADDAMAAALSRLERAAAELVLAPTGVVVRPAPGGWPEPGALAQTFEAGPGDQALPGYLLDLEDTLIRATAQFASVDDVADLDRIRALNEELVGLAGFIGENGLQASPQALMGQLDAIERILQERLPDALHATANVAAGLLRRDLQEAGLGVPERPFGLIGLTLSILPSAGIRSTLIDKIYGPFIEELDAMINTLIIADIVEDAFVVGGGPSILLVQASASVSFACPGYQTHVYGSGFDPAPGNNTFLIIGPHLTNAAEAVWDAFPDEGDSLYDVWEGVDNAVNEINDALDASFAQVVRMQRDDIFADWDLFLGPFPVEHDGRLPTPIVIFPINYFSGMGASYEISLLPRCG